MNESNYNWPRIKDLPQEEQEPFNKWLDEYGQTRPMIDGIIWEEQDGYYEWDYDRWKLGMFPHVMRMRKRRVIQIGGERERNKI